MTGFWISVLVFSTMYPVQSGRHRVTAQSSESDVYQPDKKLIVDIGDSATLQCYIFEVEVEEMIFFKQQNRKQPRIIVRFFNAARETFYNEFQNPRFQIKKHTNCFNLTILNTTLSDEAVYYCALTRPDPVFGEGTDLKFKGQSFTTESETSKPALCDHNTNMNTQEKTEVTRSLHSSVLGLGTALGLCALLIFCLIYFILRRRKWDKMKASTEGSAGTREDSHVDSWTYAALQFPKKGSGVCFSDKLVYSEVMYMKL
ncbi:uncharacterized protein LOC132890000 isoform X1 [Neoarius graeffei]|uniref:uncharacterized protein LOC132890000 isoform X1 n=1 Tax=Neoarius graeffei TaxID=443677 RepID=UPI00298BDF5A|nr:uncharacterized protein LOC132890000 isoform X1 [Neoarius graeffei]